MKLGRLLLVLSTLLALSPFSSMQAGANQRHGVRVTEYNEGRPLCPFRRIVIGNVVVRGAHCYVVVAVRDGQGAFLGFVDPPVRIPRGQVVRLDSAEGTKLRARILYRVPLPAQVSGHALPIPMNTLQLVRLRQVDEEVEDTISNPEQGFEVTHPVRSQLTVIMTAATPPTTSVTFAVHF